MAIAVGNPKKVKGLTVVRRPSGKVSADEPGDIQPAGGNRLLNKKPLQPVESPDLGMTKTQETAGANPQKTSAAINSGGLKDAVTKRIYGKKKPKGVKLEQ